MLAKKKKTAKKRLIIKKKKKKKKAATERKRKKKKKKAATKRTSRPRGRPKKKLTEKQREKEAKDYQQDWYDRNKGKVSRQRKKRWKENADLRDSQAQRDKEARSIKRAEKQAEKIEELKKCSDVYWAQHGLQKPRLLRINRRDVVIYSTGHLAKHVYRSPQTVRRWITRRVIPGATTVTSAGWSWFDVAFMNCVFVGMSRAMLLDGRTPESLLQQLIMEELNLAAKNPVQKRPIWSPYDA